MGGHRLTGLVAGSVVLVVIAAECPSFLTPTAHPGFFPRLDGGPLHGLWPRLTRDPGTLEWLVSSVIAAIYVLYLTAAAAAGLHLRDLSTQSDLVTAIGPPNLLGLELGQGGETPTPHIVIDIALGLTVAGRTVWAVRHPTRWLSAAAVAMLALIVSLSWSAPWYILWALPFVALEDRTHRLRIAVAGLGVYLILAFIPAAVPLERALRFNPSTTPLGIRHTEAIAAVVR